MTMKMIYSTSKTSISGVTLISLRVPELEVDAVMCEVPAVMDTKWMAEDPRKASRVTGGFIQREAE